jgi:hypothetical protein
LLALCKVARLIHGLSSGEGRINGRSVPKHGPVNQHPDCEDNRQTSRLPGMSTYMQHDSFPSSVRMRSAHPEAGLFNVRVRRSTSLRLVHRSILGPPYYTKRSASTSPTSPRQLTSGVRTLNHDGTTFDRGYDVVARCLSSSIRTRMQHEPSTEGMMW